jgi:two-component system sensor histidine kinase RpfC
MPVQQAAFDLPDLLDEVRRMLIGAAREKGLRLNVHVTARSPRNVVGDPDLVREVLLNLVANALKFTSRGSVTLALDAPPADELRLRFEITDTGIGISADAQERIFEAFVQANADIANQFGGTGLGLAICRRTVAVLGGEIGVRSTEGQGSTFWCELPVGRH